MQFIEAMKKRVFTVLGAPDLSEEICEYWFGLGEDHPPTTTMDTTLAGMLLRPGPVQALTTARFKEAEEDGAAAQVPRIYIKTTMDNVVKPEQQEAMIKRWEPSDVYVLETDHSPFFSAPFLLFGLLVKAAISVGC
ncbi:methyl esterase 17 [Striga asiatica]|uniref:Methyl esterase 17 n=1 Tax=Striga asiatica TaxID=4170 RepID=A0A5A7PGQ4_STRAF|nr:methyl esterase 17 [Striga asiatica]